MLKNIVITTFRNLLRNKVYALINMFGLGTGMAACLLIFAIVKYELSYDRFQPNYPAIYHIFTQDDYPDGISYTPGIPYPALEALRADLPQARLAPLYSSYGCQVIVTDPSGTPVPSKKFIEEVGFFFTEPTFFDVFEYEWLAGNPEQLNEPNTVVLTENIAKKYFGTWQSALNQTIKIDNLYHLKVSGILQNPPANSDFPLRIIASFITFKNSNSRDYTTEWGSTTSNFQIYGLFPPSQSLKNINDQLHALAAKYYTNGGKHKRVNLARPLSEIHFDERVGNLGFTVTHRSTLTTLSLIAFLIITMACINFINLATALSVNRSKEVGVRKVLGSNRLQLFRQFMGETTIITFISGLLAICIAVSFSPFIKNIITIQEELKIITWPNMLFLTLCMASVSILAGTYPSLVLSAFSPTQALKNKLSSKKIGGISLRRALVVLQFSISQALIIATIIAISQMNFVRNADLGFNKEELLIIGMNNNEALIKKRQAFESSLKQIPGVKDLSFCSDVPSSNSNWGSNFAFDNKPDENFTVYMKFGDENYQNTFGLKMAAGHWYKNTSDTMREVVINETLMRRLGIKEANQAIGKVIRVGGGQWKNICGVVSDFKTNTLKEGIRPLAIQSSGRDYYTVAVKLKSGNLNQARQKVENCWNNFFPQDVFSAQYYTENIENFYHRELQMTLVYKIFAALAVFISCLGLYGLVSFMTLQRTKEVGIRKVLGAGVNHILLIFSKEFTLLVILAFLVATPLAWFFMNKWLQTFVYKIEISVWIFAAAFAASMLLAWLAVGYKSLRAALANPVKSLRNE